MVLNFLLLFIWTGSIPVAASPPTLQAWAEGVTDLPEGCFQKTLNCAVLFSSPTVVNWNGQSLHVGEGSSLLVNRDGVFQLLAGVVWCPKWENATFRHGNFRWNLQGDVELEKSDHRLLIRNLDGRVTSAHEDLPAGFENWYEGLGQGNEVLQGVARPLQWDVFVSSWLQLAQEPASRLRELLSIYRERRGQAISLSSDMYKKAVQSRLVAAARVEHAKTVAERASQREKVKLHEMMLRRYFHPEE
ncbi:MAG: hypothetical protein C5B49_11900 [Bdellovibrio sp.]|nr:MAG: hypothetical protein C5B49_11900 [Bdellovibrio sp.]